VTCQRCRKPGALAISAPVSFMLNGRIVRGRVCNDCGADLFEEWKAERDAAACEEMSTADYVPDPDAPF
jgi:hypothetical protein